MHNDVNTRIPVLRYSGAAFEPRTPHFSVEKLETFPQLISNEVSACVPNIL